MKKFPSLHLVLFILTFLSMLVAGALFQKGVDIFNEPRKILEGLPFALTLMVILLSHELSHYFTSKKHHTKATLPYFIPAPSLIGTFGAFIKMKSPIITRKALIDIGASGPIAGFILSVIAAIVGLHYSSVVSVAETSGGLRLGDSILFSLLTRVVIGTPPDSCDILLHPVAFAGWIGLFVTSLNLIPIGQLDGGHIAYAFLRERHRVLSIVLVVTLLVLGLFFWEMWAVWGALMIVLGLRHPPVIYWEVPLDRKRKIAGALAFIIFIITFMPSPFTILD
ncbi:MAG: site-2 protease family protein [Nitrospirae bacterium]|nr:site-2 protease family protein [Nitrospirota bacterium]MCL5422978.1 site-2 protease family protein [Nitrospirota bacterium]